MTNTLGSRRISSAMASRKASRTVIVTISVPSGTSASTSGSGCGAVGGCGAGGAGISGARAVSSGAGRASARAGGADSAAFCGCTGAARLSTPASSPSATLRADGGPPRPQDLAERAVVDRLDLHGRLVGLDLGDDVARLDLVALALDPLGEVPLLHRGRQRGHQHLNRHWRP